MFSSILLNLLIEWIILNTNFKNDKIEIKVNVVSEKILQMKACKGKCPIVAFYDKNEGIFISNLNFKDNYCNQSILIHEIIHVFQDYEKKELNFAFREKEAYEIQNKFLLQKSEKEGFLRPLNVKVCRSIQK